MASSFFYGQSFWKGCKTCQTSKSMAVVVTPNPQWITHFHCQPAKICASEFSKFSAKKSMSLTLSLRLLWTTQKITRARASHFCGSSQRHRNISKKSSACLRPSIRTLKCKCFRHFIQRYLRPSRFSQFSWTFLLCDKIREQITLKNKA